MTLKGHSQGHQTAVLVDRVDATLLLLVCRKHVCVFSRLPGIVTCL